MMEIGIRIFRNALVSLACFWQIARMVKREVRSKKNWEGLKRGRDYAVLLFFPLPLCRFCFSLRSLFRATLSSGGTEYQGEGGGGGSKQTQFGLKIRGARAPWLLPWICHCYRNACNRLWLVKTMKQRYMLIDYNPGVHREENCDITLPW